MSFSKREDGKKDKKAGISKIQCFIFDLDGTLLNRPPSLPREANIEALKLLCTEEHGLDELLTLMRQVSSKFTDGKGILASKTRQFELLLNILGIEDSSLANILFEKYMGYYLSIASLYPDAINTLKAISDQDIKIGLITNSPDDIVVGVLMHFGIDKYFNFIAAASLVHYPKPSVEFGDFLVERACSEPNAIAIAGDGDEDSITAKMIGARFYRVSRNLEGSMFDTDSCGVLTNLNGILNIIEQ